MSKACRYDDADWSDCDAFELVRFRVLHLLHGGRQCEEVKNITKHCTPEELPPGTREERGTPPPPHPVKDPPHCRVKNGSSAINS